MVLRSNGPVEFTRRFSLYWAHLTVVFDEVQSKVVCKQCCRGLINTNHHTVSGCAPNNSKMYTLRKHQCWHKRACRVMFLGLNSTLQPKDPKIMASSLVYSTTPPCTIPFFSFSMTRHGSSAQLGLMCFYLRGGGESIMTHTTYTS